MKCSVAVVLAFLLSITPCPADEITDAISVAEKAIEEASKTTDAKRKAEKYTEAKAALTKTIDNIKASKKIYADEEIAPLYLYRGDCNFDLREYEQAHEDFSLASKLNPNKITPWLRLSQIKSSAPVDKLRNGKEALAAAENAFKSLKLYAAKEPRTALEKFQHSVSVMDLRDEIALATATAHAEMGDFKEAIRLIKDGRQEVVKKYLDLYRDGKPYRLPAKP